MQADRETESLANGKIRKGSLGSLFLYQIGMILDCLFNFLRFDADIPLCGACAAVLQQPLHKGYIEAVGIVDFRCVPLAEAVGADPLKAQVITDNMKLLLDCPFRYGENQVSAPDTVAPCPSAIVVPPCGRLF